MEDPRKNLPSASGLERLKRCRGSWNLEKQLTNIAPSALAERGTKIHSALDGSFDKDELEDQELFIYDRCKEIEDVIISEVFDHDHEVIDRLILISEERIFLLDENGNEVMSGQKDKLRYDPVTRKALITDYKTGYKAVTDADANMQLRGYVVLDNQKYDLTDITVAAIQPLCTPSWAKCRYVNGHIDIARKEILHILETAKDPNAPRVPGEVQCEYCKAKSVCEELKEFALASLDSVQKVHEIILTAPQEIDLREELIPGDELSRLLDRAKLVVKWYESIKDEAVLRIRTNRVVPNYGLFPGTAKRIIVNNMNFYKEFKTFGKNIVDNPISPAEILDTATFSMGKIEKLINRNKTWKQAQLKKVLEDLFPDLIGLTTPENTLKRIKEEN